jgi:hypothetical protein
MKTAAWERNRDQPTKIPVDCLDSGVANCVALGAGASQATSPAVDGYGYGADASQTKTSPQAQPKALGDADSLMKKMQEIHEQMMAAKTPAMMNAMKTHHGGMGSNGMRHDMLEKRMDMMQMMMDREFIKNAPAGK